MDQIYTLSSLLNAVAFHSVPLIVVDCLAVVFGAVVLNGLDHGGEVQGRQSLDSFRVWDAARLVCGFGGLSRVTN